MLFFRFTCLAGRRITRRRANILITFAYDQIIISLNFTFMQQCQEYKKIYQDFKTLKDKFKEGVEKIKATGKMGKDFDDLEKRLKAKMQEMRPLLEKYFLKFSWEKKEIPGFGNNIYAFHPIGDNRILVGGNKGELRILNTANNKFEKEIIGFGNHILAFHPIGDNRVLVGGDKGELKTLKKELDLDNLE